MTDWTFRLIIVHIGLTNEQLDGLFEAVATMQSSRWSETARAGSIGP
jgi:hypothetical protein